MRDDHAKNFAFCQNSNGQWRLSPAFDLCPSAGIGLTQEHTASASGKGSGIFRADLVAFARSIGVAQPVALDGIHNARAATTEFKALAISLGATKTGAIGWAWAFKAIDSQLRPTLVPGLRKT